MSLEFNSQGVWVNPEPLPEADFYAISFENGFMPRGEPMGDLPERYSKLNEILKDMSVTKPDGSEGLLAKNEFRKTVKESLPNYLEQVKQETDSQMICTLHRDYAHMASAYALEPCDLHFKATRSERGGDYGKADAYLPASIAQPLDYLANRLKSFPWLDYALDYCLGNIKLADPSVGHVAPNLVMVRTMNGGPDERGFTIVHLLMEIHTGALIKAGMDLFNAIADSNHKDAQKALTSVYECARDINAVRETMWRECKKENYLELRTWIFGITGTDLFPKEGLHFEGCPDPWRSYRGETGAQSTIIPFLDTIMGVNTVYPANELTRYLLELRAYRPYHHRTFLQAVEDRATKLQVLPFFESDPNTLVCWLRCLNEIRAFRQGHWNFTKQYIINNSDYPVATGGTPITTWLPNQLGATMELMQTAFDHLKEENWEDKITDEYRPVYDDILSGHDNLLKFLHSEVEKLREQFQQ